MQYIISGEIMWQTAENFLQGINCKCTSVGWRSKQR